MACESCKKRKSFNEKMNESGDFISRSTVVFVIIWSLFSLYGIYSLISKFL